jgi:hypothetical protein
MTDWKAELHVLIERAKALARAKSHDQPLPRKMIQRAAGQEAVNWGGHDQPLLGEMIEPGAGLDPVDWVEREREEIAGRVAKFRAHQQRLIQQREDYAESTLLKIRELLQSADRGLRSPQAVDNRVVMPPGMP